VTPGAGRMPAVSVIVPARDAAATLGHALDALAEQRVDGGFEVVIVDDGSADGTAELAGTHPLAPRIVAADGSGPARARNAGAAAASAPALAFLDADCAPAAGWLAAGLSALDDADLVQGAVTTPPGESVGPYDKAIWVERETGLYETANLFVTREAFERAGGFESWLTPRRGIELGEDVWFGWRARRAGARTAFCADAVVHHAVFPRGPGGWIAWRARIRYFPAMAGRIPELREFAFYRRVFMSPRTAAFDLAVAGAVVGTARRRPLLAAAAAAPYARILARDALRWGGRSAPAIAAVRVVGDVVTAGALLTGSIRARSPLF
jgi:glycosyltransferase involved in cell wall biosynthesis